MQKIITFEFPFVEALFIRREKRFLVECEFYNGGESFWVHTNNTGSMLGLLRKGQRVLLSAANNPKRKLAWTLEAVYNPSYLASGDGIIYDKNISPWIGVNTSVPNMFLKEIFNLQANLSKPLANSLPELLLEWTRGYDTIRMEVKNQESRLDALITSKDEKKPELWVECKSVTLVEDDVASFPDAVSERGTKHLETLMRLVSSGARGAMCYVVQRNDGLCFSAADYIDMRYAETLKKAYLHGVEVYILTAIVKTDGIYLGRSLDLSPYFLANL